MHSDVLKKFGKYFLLDMIAQGGMAEIYRARMATPDGGGRLIAIKRIIPSYSQNPEFVSMFKAEIKTTSGFTHPNIVQLYDFGEEETTLYLAMEFVDGKNLRQFTGRFNEMKSTFPVEVSVYIIEQAAHGMGYAHSFKDKFSGKNMNIVHRDISPQNLLISYDGAVKVIDFGIAKAVTNVEATKAGLIKGKPSYLSPEQITGEVLDGRSDIFALGIVMWELLTGKKLFASENDYGVLKLIENCTTHVKPPSLYNPKIPKDLDAIVLKCLQKDRDNRYANAEELQRALHKALYQIAPDFNPADLAYYARDLFKNEIVEDRKRLLRLNDKVEQLLATNPEVLKGESDDEKTFTGEDEDSTITLSRSSGKVSKKKKEEDKSGSFRLVEFKEKAGIELDLEGKVTRGGVSGNLLPNRSGGGDFKAASRGGSTSGGFAVRQNQQQKTASSASSMAAAIAVLLLGAGGYWFYQSKTARDPASQNETGFGTVVVQGNLSAATVTMDDKVVATSLPATLRNIPADRSVKIVVSSNGYRKYVSEVSLGMGEMKTVVANLARDANDDGSSKNMLKKPVTLRFSVTPAGLGTQIHVNGSLIDVAGVTASSTGAPLDIVVEREGFRTYKKTLTIDAAQVAADGVYPISVSLDPAKFGYISIKTTPSAEAILMIDGTEERWSTPISRRRIPVGKYKIKLLNSLLGMEKDLEIVIEEDRFANIEERLSVSAGSDDAGSSERSPSSH